MSFSSKNLIFLLLSFCLLFIANSSTSYASTLNCATATGINIPVNECQALLDLYDSTNGSGWTNTGGWDTDTDAGTWFGVSTDGANVIGLSLSNNNLSGTLPSSLSILSSIQFFYADGNQIGGTLPSSISTRTNLGEFNLSGNQLEGTLPDSRSGLTNVYFIRLSYNQLTGPLPTSRSALSNMGYLQVNNNQLEGTLPAARSSWVGMTLLDISNNQFVGSLPSSWGSRSFIRYFYAQNNLLSGPLPSSRSTFTSLRGFDVSSNLLSGAIPSTWYPARPNRLSVYIRTDDNCMQNTGYSTGMQSWLSINALISPQNDCTVIPPTILSPTSGQVLTTGNIVVSGTGQVGNIISVTLSGITLTDIIDGSRLRSILFNAMTDGLYTTNVFETDSLSTYDSITVTSNFSVAIPIPPVPTPTPSGGGGGGGASLQKDDCPNGDNSPSYYDNNCGGPSNSGTIDPSPSETKPITETKPTEAEAGCIPIKSHETTMTDIKGMPWENAVIQLLRLCIVDGYGNKGKVYGGGRMAKYGEIYKMVYNLVGKQMDITTVQNHRSDPYYRELNKMGLLKGITIPSDPSKPIPPSVFYAIIKNILDYKSINDTLLEKELRNDIRSSLIMRRGTVATVIAKLSEQ